MLRCQMDGVTQYSRFHSDDAFSQEASPARVLTQYEDVHLRIYYFKAQKYSVRFYTAYVLFSCHVSGRAVACLYVLPQILLYSC